MIFDLLTAASLSTTATTSGFIAVAGYPTLSHSPLPTCRRPVGTGWNGEMLERVNTTGLSVWRWCVYW